MSYELARQILTQFFVNNFKRGDASEWFPVEFPNHPLSADLKEPSVAWGRFSIQNGRKLNREVGTGSTRTPGLATLQIFLPEDSGTKLANEAGDQVVSFVENHQLALPAGGIIRFREVSVREVGKDSGWNVTNVDMPFERDEFNAEAAAAAGFAILPAGFFSPNEHIMSMIIPIEGDLIGLLNIPVVFDPPAAVAPAQVLRPTMEKSDPAEDNIDAISVDSITRFGYTVNLNAAAIAGQKLHCYHIFA